MFVAINIPPYSHDILFTYHIVKEKGGQPPWQLICSTLSHATPNSSKNIKRREEKDGSYCIL